MNMKRLIRRAIWSWQNWKNDRRTPEDIKRLRAERKEASRQHKATKKLDKQLVNAVARELRGGV